MPRFFLFNISMYCLLFGLPFETESLYYTYWPCLYFRHFVIRWFYQEVCLIINICRNCLLSRQRQKFWRVESEVRPQEAEPRVRTNSGMGWSGTGRRMSLPGRDYLVSIWWLPFSPLNLYRLHDINTYIEFDGCKKMTIIHNICQLYYTSGYAPRGL